MSNSTFNLTYQKDLLHIVWFSQLDNYKSMYVSV